MKAALDTLPDKQRRAAAQQQLAGGGAGSGGGSSALVSALQHAAGLVAKLRDSSAYRWVDLGAVFQRLRGTGAHKAAGGAAAAAAAVGGASAARVGWVQG